MAFQPLFATMHDSLGREVQSRSRSGCVEDLYFWVNSKFGEVCRIACELHDGRKHVSRPDLRRIPAAKRAAALEAYEAAVKANSYVSVRVTPYEDGPARVVVGSYDAGKLKKLETFLGTDKLLKTDLPYEYWVGLMPEYHALMAVDEKDKARYSAALDAFIARRDRLLAMYEEDKSR